jgi:hypothetical protein
VRAHGLPALVPVVVAHVCSSAVHVVQMSPTVQS